MTAWFSMRLLIWVIGFSAAISYALLPPWMDCRRGVALFSGELLGPSDTLSRPDDFRRLLSGSVIEFVSVSGNTYRIRFLRMGDPHEVRRLGNRQFVWGQREGRPEPEPFMLDRLRVARVVSIPDFSPTTVNIAGLTVRHFGSNPSHHVALLRRHGFSFSDPITFRQGDGTGVTYRFSQPFAMQADRIGVYGLVQRPGEPPTLRLFYGSLSHGVFRLLPAIRVRGESMAGRYDKGEDEAGLAVPWQVDQHLRQIARRSPIRLSPSELGELEEASVYVHRMELEREVWTLSQDYIGNQVRVRRLFPGGTASPGTTELPLPQRVDYSSVVGQYESVDPLLGPIDVIVYSSRDRSLHYVFHRARSGPRVARIADIQVANSSWTDLGVASEAVDPGMLTTNVWDHHWPMFQLVDGAPVSANSDALMHPRISHYSSQWSDVRALPEIQRAYAHWGIPIPASPVP